MTSGPDKHSNEEVFKRPYGVSGMKQGMNHLLKRVKQDIEAHGLIEKGWRVVAGVSGGADSVALLHMLMCLQEDLGFSLTAVHVHHGLRGSEADGDAALVRDLCARWEIPFELHYADVKAVAQSRGISVEEAGREERYRIFSQVLERTGAQAIAVAHQMEDQAETVMLHLLRGTGLDGLCGMAMRQGCIIRPLLHISRREILAYLKAHHLDYREDSTNLSNDYTRNRIRNTLFPSINELFQVDIHEQLVKLSHLARDDRDYLEQAAKAAFERCLTEEGEKAPGLPYLALSIEKMKSFHPALIKRIIRLAWERINTNRKNLEWLHVSQILELMDKGTGKRLCLPCNTLARVAYGQLIMTGNTHNEGEMPRTHAYAYTVVPEGLTYAREAGGTLSAAIMPAPEAYARYGRPGALKEKDLVQLFDYDKLKGGITLRNRREGDRIHLRGSKGEKKLKEYFIDAKIPREQRLSIPLVALGNKVIWVIGRRTSQAFSAQEETQRVWVLSWNSHDGGENSNV